jgi:hypothetical protein
MLNNERPSGVVKKGQTRVLESSMDQVNCSADRVSLGEVRRYDGRSSPASRRYVSLADAIKHSAKCFRFPLPSPRGGLLPIASHAKPFTARAATELKRVERREMVWNACVRLYQWCVLMHLRCSILKGEPIQYAPAISGPIFSACSTSCSASFIATQSRMATGLAWYWP